MDDVPLREHVEAVALERDKRYSAERAADQLAIQVADEAAKEMIKQHNGLIDQMKEMQATFALKPDLKRLETWQARLTGGMLLLAFIGIANLVTLMGG